jgi:hypothetical protein
MQSCRMLKQVVSTVTAVLWKINVEKCANAFVYLSFGFSFWNIAYNREDVSVWRL